MNEKARKPRCKSDHNHMFHKLIKRTICGVRKNYRLGNLEMTTDNIEIK